MMDYLPSAIGSTFNHLCRLWGAIHDIVLHYYGVNRGASRPSGVDPLFVQRKYRELLAWGDQLPSDLARSGQSSHHVFIAQ